MFRLPRNAPAGWEEHFYSFDHGDAHFVSLDADDPGGPRSLRGRGPERGRGVPGAAPVPSCAADATAATVRCR